MYTDNPESDYQRHLELQEEMEEDFVGLTDENVKILKSLIKDDLELHIERMMLKRSWFERLRNWWILLTKDLVL